MLFLGLLLSLSQGAFAADGKIGAPAQQKQTIESQVAKPVSFVEAVQNGQPTGLPQGLPEVKEKYADKVLKDDVSFLGSCVRGPVKFGLFTALLLSTKNFNLAYAGTGLTDEALIAAGLFKDSKIIRSHKDATWWQWCKASDAMISGLPIDASEYTDSLYGRMANISNVLTIGVLSLLDENTMKKYQKNANRNHNYGHWLTIINYCAVEELVRQKMIKSEESPRIANMVAIALAAAINEGIKKTI